jgi:hypothetical protein
MDQLTTLSAKNQDEFVEVSGQLLHDQIQSFLERQVKTRMLLICVSNADLFNKIDF